MKKSDKKWQKHLKPEVFRITREKGTEAPFSGEYYNCKDKGIYKCTCCGADLFNSDEKYDSGSGWPSFWQPIKDQNIKYEEDASHGMVRTEIMCQQCGAHLGHVFDDGPEPTGKRYCVNSLSLKLDKKK